MAKKEINKYKKFTIETGIGAATWAILVGVIGGIIKLFLYDAGLMVILLSCLTGLGVAIIVFNLTGKLVLKILDKKL